MLSFGQWILVAVASWILFSVVGGTWFFANPPGKNYSVLWKRIVGGIMFFPALVTLLGILGWALWAQWTLLGNVR